MNTALAKSLDRLDQYEIAITIADVSVADAPLTHVNDAFCTLTGYTRDEVIGRNCRFLQGEMTDRSEIEKLKRAIQVRRPFTSILTNYRKDGSMFHNLLMIGQVDRTAGRDTIVGCQHELSQTADLDEVYAQIRSVGKSISNFSDDAQSSWTSYIENLTMQSEAVRHLLQIYHTRATVL